MQVVVLIFKPLKSRNVYCSVQVAHVTTICFCILSFGRHRQAVVTNTSYHIVYMNNVRFEA